MEGEGRRLGHSPLPLWWFLRSPPLLLWVGKERGEEGREAGEGEGREASSGEKGKEVPRWVGKERKAEALCHERKEGRRRERVAEWLRGCQNPNTRIHIQWRSSGLPWICGLGLIYGGGSYIVPALVNKFTEVAVLTAEVIILRHPQR